MPNRARQIAFEPVRESHLAMLGEWMRRPHWREWWGDPDEEVGFVRDMVAGHDTTRPYLIMIDGKPSGYIQVWFIGHHQNAQWIKDNPWLADLPADAVGVDLSLADAESLSKGLGSAALRAFVEELRGQGHETIVIDPDLGNARAVRAYTKAGFRPIPDLEGRTEGVLIMKHEMKHEQDATEIRS